jgi:glutathione synthase
MNLSVEGKAMPIRVGVVMDPIAHIKVAKDSSLAMLREVARRGWQLVYMELADLYLDNDQGMARMRPLQVFEDDNRWFALGEPAVAPLGELDVILMRKDPGRQQTGQPARCE